MTHLLRFPENTAWIPVRGRAGTETNPMAWKFLHRDNSWRGEDEEWA